MKSIILCLCVMTVLSPKGIVTSDAPIFVPKAPYELLSYQSSKEQYKLVVAQEFGSDFVKTVECESGFRHYNKDGSILRSPMNTNGTYDWSWLQLNDVHRPIAKRLGIVWEKMTPGEAVLIAKEVIKKQGKKAWVGCKSKV